MICSREIHTIPPLPQSLEAELPVFTGFGDRDLRLADRAVLNVRIVAIVSFVVAAAILYYDKTIENRMMEAERCRHCDRKKSKKDVVNNVCVSYAIRKRTHGTIL